MECYFIFVWPEYVTQIGTRSGRKSFLLLKTAIIFRSVIAAW